MAAEKSKAKSFSVKDSEGSLYIVTADYFMTSNDGNVSFFVDNAVVAIFRDFKFLRQQEDAK